MNFYKYLINQYIYIFVIIRSNFGYALSGTRTALHAPGSLQGDRRM